MNVPREPDLSSARSMHRYVEAYNWDDGVGVLIKIAKHELCDRGTALAIFWRSGAAHLLRYSSRDQVPVIDLDAYDLIKAIEARYLADDFVNRSVLFNPRNDGGTDWTADYQTAEAASLIPEALTGNSMVPLGQKPSRKVMR